MIKAVEIVHGLGRGGAERLLYERLRYQTKPDVPIDTTVINACPRLDAYEAVIRDIGITVANCGGGTFPRRMRNVVKAIHSIKPDLLIVHSPSVGAPLKMARGSRLLHTPLIEVIHSTAYAKRSVTLAARATARFADGAVCISRAVAGTSLASPRNPIAVIHPSIDVEGLRSRARMAYREVSTIRDQILLGGGSTAIVSVGSLHKFKGHTYLIRAMAGLPTGFRLAVVGAGPEASRLEALVHELGLTDRVLLVGEVADGWKWMDAADIVCHPSIREGFSLALVEAIALGKPIVASDEGGIPEVLSFSRNSRLVPPANPRLLAEALRGLATQDSDVLENPGPIPALDISHYTTELWAFVAEVIPDIATRLRLGA